MAYALLILGKSKINIHIENAGLNAYGYVMNIITALVTTLGYKQILCRK